jgi:hypothetical protein
MWKHIIIAGLLLGPIGASPARLAAQPAQMPGRCLHGPNEPRNQQLRREQAIKVAQQINRVEYGGAVLTPPARREFLPLDQLRGVPAAPAGFHLQFHTDGATYTFSLKDTLDACGYAIYSDQDQGIYGGTPLNAGARVVPVETR